MPSELSVSAVHQGGMKVTATAGEHGVTMDYPARPGNAGFTPLQLLLASLGGCAANTVALLLDKAGVPHRDVEVQVRGRRRDEHPTVFTDIALAFTVRGPDVDPAAVRRVVAAAESQICPVWAMLKPGTAITSTVSVEP